MTKQYLLTVDVPAMPDADRLALIQNEIITHAEACWTFYGPVKPAMVKCCDLKEVMRGGRIEGQ